MNASQVALLSKIEELERRCPGSRIHRNVLDDLARGPIYEFRADIPTWSGRKQTVRIGLLELGQTFEEWLDAEILRHPGLEDDACYDARYNVICPVHGKVQIGKSHYDYQMSRPDDPWVCTICSAVSEFDDDSYEHDE